MFCPLFKAFLGVVYKENWEWASFKWATKSVSIYLAFWASLR